MNKTIFIAGPSASGKSTLSRRLASEIGFHWLDTGSVIRMTAFIMEQEGIKLPDSYEAAEETPVPPWSMGELGQTLDWPIFVNGKLLEYDNPQLRNPKYDTSTVFLARALRPKTWDLLERVSMIGQSVISCRQVPEKLVHYDEILPIYLDLSPQDRVLRRAIYENREVDLDIVQRIVGKEFQNISVGNLISPENAVDSNYVLVKNNGTLDRSAAQLLLEVLLKYQNFTPEDYEYTLDKLQDADHSLKHYTHWAELALNLRINSHPEGHTRRKEY